ncbi:MULTISPECIES: GGDEF domain-containing protein [Paenibacillus]|uniref:Chemotaxis protein CheY n=1 Tax=Paenibacillus polymyxa (strain SC2) TaxID=886882 RepID=E3EHA7_PAEPS|nr:MULTISPECIES: GGDEF domain-containing protein [Paenibacillus]MCV9950725.1 GGDEF domain-containing protein [Paenibacillus sp. BT-177]ADO55898.1 chemotaxis protein CheY [Paenibacillus polymyxa SC2]MBU9708276.1 GGDEF domain-containing protein [Paenibacillus sp. AK121]MEE4568303.1 GGDEF domain-containing protein [Paenibacillus polymyxa]WPQ58612.1 GGDEF domain-containing protein [Paenibacillus polymyxa]
MLTLLSLLGTLGSPSLAGAISAACGLYIILMMALMCVIIYSRQRKKAYILFSVAAIFIMTYEAMNLYSAGGGQMQLQGIVWKNALEAFAFLLINAAVFQLYRKLKRVEKWALLLLAALLILPVMAWTLGLLPTWISSVKLVGFTLFYRVLVLILSLLFITPRIGQPKKFIAGLFTYSLWLGFLWLQNDIPEEANGSSTVLWMSFLPLLYYTTLFIILFERIVELLQRIYRSSITDGLTGLYNRKYFSGRLRRYMDQGIRVSVIFCDIDNFKKLNDTQGHARADEVLKQVAQIMEEELDEIGLTGRYGGEELVAMVVDRRAKVAQVAERIRERVAEESIVTISVGHSTAKKEINPDELVKQADQAMYISKTTGKNKVTAYKAAEVKQSRAARAQ